MQTPAPAYMKWISIVLLVWNVIGIGFFASQWAMGPDEIAKLPPIQQFLWKSMTARVWIAYALAVFAGSLGAVALLLRRTVALPLFAISLIAVIVQFTNPALLEVAGREGIGFMAFPLFIMAVAGVQFVLALRWRGLGWLR